MRKNDLIKQLQELKGNPEVVLWNGHVGDYMHIGNLVESDLVKIEQKHWLDMCLLEDRIDRKDWNYQMPAEEVQRLRKLYAEIPYEIDEYVSEEQIKQKKYKRKAVVFLQPKPRGIKTFDRLGGIEY